MPANAVDRLAGEISNLAGSDVELERPHDPSHGDYATNVALRTAPAHRRSPREFAAELAQQVSQLPDVERAEVAGPGFVNLWLEPRWYVEALGEMDDAYGGGFAQPHQRIQVELVSANPVAPLTVGSARNGAYGDSVARLLRFAGHQVEEEYYFNNAGRQIDLFRTATTRIGHSSVRRTGPICTSPPTSRTSGTSWSAASTSRSTSSVPTTTGTSRGSRRPRRCSATTRSGSRR